ncbi:MAG: DUF4178 domain-containing protein [Myxococcales bacterium]|nr:DUF4178 domain-containing protein [Myxococcales bacterium]
MTAACPTCGAPVEFRYDDSFVRVCGSCRSSVLRTDRGVETLGQFADLTPLASPFWLFAGGAIEGVAFQIEGRVQIRHAAGGVWQEWFAKFADGRWGWIAEAQGRFFVTFEAHGAAALPAFDLLRPGASVDVLVPVRGSAKATPATFYVAEFGAATYIAGQGELPFRVAAGESYRFADLSDGTGRFASIDYGAAGHAKPTLFVGRELGLAEFNLPGSAPAAAPGSPTLRARKLACPQCHGSIELQNPDASLRVGCPYCGALLDCEGDLKILAKFGGKRIKPLLPLGTHARFEGEKFAIIGYMRRAAVVDRTEYPFDEYLLHHPAKGYRWLVCADGHWSYVSPLDPGSVRGDLNPSALGATFKHFSTALVAVKFVVGEFYWRVAVDDQVLASDYIAPPYMLSKEAVANEVTWSLGRYLTADELRTALAQPKLVLPRADGVAPNQPFRHQRAKRATGVAVLIFLVTALLLGMVVSRSTQHEEWLTTQPDPEGRAVAFSKPFTIKANRNIRVRLEAPVSNSWLAIGGDLLNDASGELDAFDAEVAYYSGVDGGESWSEGSRAANIFIGSRPAGSYVLRVETEGPPGQPGLPVRAIVTQGVFRTIHFFLAFLVVGVPWLILWVMSLRFEHLRKVGSDAGSPWTEFFDDSDDE